MENLRLSASERLALRLRALYDLWGYSLYRMNRMEEYGFYLENMSFLSDKRLIAFSDLDGRLMALKPDVTMSIAKSAAKNPAVGVSRLYYTENVFRPARYSREYRELKQLGLECIGELDDYVQAECVLLAAKSLDAISSDSVLCVSHTGIVGGLIGSLGADYALSSALIDCVRVRNAHDCARLCADAGISTDDAERLCGLIRESSPTVSFLRIAADGDPVMNAGIDTLEMLISSMPMGRISIDLSIVPDTEYYNGLTMQGYVNGVPDPVLSGGRYDNLLHRMGSQQQAIGFALYLDRIDALLAPDLEATPRLVRYSADEQPQSVLARMEQLTQSGLRACAENTGINESTEMKI